MATMPIEIDPRVYRIAGAENVGAAELVAGVVGHLLDLEILGQLYREAKDAVADPQSRRRTVADACSRAAASTRNAAVAEAWRAMARYFVG